MYVILEERFMPVLGHAFAGLAMGLCARPAAPGVSSPRPGAIGPALWLPIVVGLAYLPDMATQLLSLTGWSEARPASHSLLFALLAASALAPLLARALGMPTLRFFLIALGSIVLHDLLDLAQATDRVPWWPLSTQPVTLPWIRLPAEPRQEALWFAGAFLVFFVARHLIHRLRGRPTSPAGAPAARPRAAWPGHALVTGMVVAAALTHHLRDVRE